MQSRRRRLLISNIAAIVEEKRVKLLIMWNMKVVHVVILQ
jgi:hypothetical protein